MDVPKGKMASSTVSAPAPPFSSGELNLNKTFSEGRRSCKYKITCFKNPVYKFACAGMLCSTVHNMVYSILSISLITIAKEFGLTFTQRGFILSGFSLTYACFQIPGGVFVQKFGAFIGPFLSSMGSCASLLAIPFLIDNVSDSHASAVMYIFYGAMLVLGALGAGFNPAFHTMISYKVTVEERSLVHNVVYSGQQLGSILSTVGVDIGISAFGWRNTFVIAAAICFVAGLVWFLAVDTEKMPNVHDAPDSSYQQLEGSPKFTVEKFRDDKEADRLEEQHFTRYEKWKAVLIAPAFWVICVNHFGSVWVSRVAVNWGPTFLHSRAAIPFLDLGYLAALPRVFGFFVILGSGKLAFYLVGERNWTVVQVRKVLQTVGLSIPALLLIWMNYETNTVLVSALFLLATAFNVITFCGYHVNHIDISPDPTMTGLMYAITNTIGQIAGITEPLIDGAILQVKKHGENVNHEKLPSPSLSAWTHVWYIVVGVSVVCTVLWNIFCKGTPLPVRKLQ